eukprot:190451-Chlamydomonas_euryale.AAC.5
MLPGQGVGSLKLDFGFIPSVARLSRPKQSLVSYLLWHSYLTQTKAVQVAACANPSTPSTPDAKLRRLLPVPTIPHLAHPMQSYAGCCLCQPFHTWHTRCKKALRVTACFSLQVDLATTDMCALPCTHAGHINVA